ncbi:MAG: hypothetical protein UT20_C0033G0004 [Candidatus Levybacteria bacterium GW2011_GWA1_39_11]|nr:MAG: hypothetical protein UT20_C0033G0004 [Candidatus Levybacteria bacterium GW2011_GWA1_39_11]
MTDMQTKKFSYLGVYNDAHKNAVDLLNESKILFDKECYSRAYFLAYTALEEISKSQFAADVCTGFHTEEDFLAFYTDHGMKNKNIGWAHHDANSYPHNLIWVGPDRDDVETINAEKPLFGKRNNSLYVGISNNCLKLPKNEVSEKDAMGIIHITETALERIWDMTENWGHQIGTKGFMK